MNLQFLKNFRKEEKAFFFWAALCSFFICAGYAVVRPVSDALFLSNYTASSLPYAWMILIPFNALAVSLYNRGVFHIGPWRVFIVALVLIMGVDVLAVFQMKKGGSFPFVFYLWKEVYIMILFQLLWSVIGANFSKEKAKYAYGIFFACGGVGGILGSAIPSLFAVSAGSENLLLAALPTFGLLFICYKKLLRVSLLPQKAEVVSSSFRKGVSLVFRSKTLFFILLIVVFMQLISTIGYYQFGSLLEMEILDKDLRTEFLGRISALIGVATLLLQLFGSALFLHFLGLEKSLIAVPAFLGSCSLISFAFPIFPVITASYIGYKAVDFSIFSVLKEMLYLPLSSEEKFQAKSIIDVFGYRFARSAGSFLIFGLQLAGLATTVRPITLLLILLFMAWGFISIRFFLRDSSKTPA